MSALHTKELRLHSAARPACATGRPAGTFTRMNARVVQLDEMPAGSCPCGQTRRAFTDLLHPSPIETTSRPGARIIELAITPPELKERREKQEGE